MDLMKVEHHAALWLEGDVPVRMVYAGRRWRVTDIPTRLRDSVWSVDPGTRRGFYGWRFQGTNDAGESFVFDVYPAEDGWHVHHAYV